MPQKKLMKGMPLVITFQQGVDIMMTMVLAPQIDNSLGVAIDTSVFTSTNGMMCVISMLPYFMLNHIEPLPVMFEGFEDPALHLFNMSQFETKNMLGLYDDDDGEDVDTMSHIRPDDDF